jgi:hypothetical protein
LREVVIRVRDPVLRLRHSLELKGKTLVLRKPALREEKRAQKGSKKGAKRASKRATVNNPNEAYSGTPSSTQFPYVYLKPWQFNLDSTKKFETFKSGSLPRLPLVLFLSLLSPPFESRRP